jgi:hypothetical protein
MRPYPDASVVFRKLLGSWDIGLTLVDSGATWRRHMTPAGTRSGKRQFRAEGGGGSDTWKRLSGS